MTMFYGLLRSSPFRRRRSAIPGVQETVFCVLLVLRSSGADLDIVVNNPPATGTVHALLFNSPNTFLNLRDPVKSTTLQFGSTMKGRIPDLPPGDYALMVYEDVNENGRLDKNFIGIPREPLGFSNHYWPKGPPTFSRAMIHLDEGETRTCDVDLKSSFGKAGLIGVGVGVIAQSSPYRGSDHAAVLPIPAITYVGDRIQILGPGVRYGLLNVGDVRLAATAGYRIGAYSEGDSPILEGMGNREGTAMGGLALRARLPANIHFSCGYENDLLGRFNGGIGRFGVERGFQSGLMTLSPYVGANWISAGLADYEYGVTASQARAGRPAYEPGSAVSFETGLSLFLELSGSWRLILSGRVEFLPPEITGSPIVGQDQVYGGFGAINRLF
ncbi:MAG: MipA/OmpV family protein [bacterium]